MRVIFPLLFPKPRTDFTGYFGRLLLEDPKNFTDVSCDKIKGPNPYHANNNNVKSKYCLDYHPTPQVGGKGVNINGEMHSTMSLTEQPRGALQ